MLHALGAEQVAGFDDTDGRAGHVVVVGAEQSRVLRGLAADEGGAGGGASVGDAAHDVGDPVGNDAAARDVVGHEDRLGADHDDVVDDHADEILADGVVLVEGLRDRDLGADAVGRGGEEGALEVLEDRDVEEAGEAPEAPDDAGSVGGRDCRLHQLDGEVASSSVNASLGVLVGHASDPIRDVKDCLSTINSTVWSTLRMCGIVGLVSSQPANQQVYDALLLLQHRGQDSTGLATNEGSIFHIHKEKGQVREAYRTRDMRGLLGNMGLGHVRYATKGTASSEQEAQPFYVNAPYGIVLVHNGNLTNTRELTKEMFEVDRRHLNTDSDTEILVNVLANELQAQVRGSDLDPEQVFDAITRLHERVEGSYAAIAMIAGHGLLAFRDPFGIRPLVLGRRTTGLVGTEWIVASESLVLESGGYELVRDVAPGEAIFITKGGELFSKQCSPNPRLVPCSFEYVYLARPDSVMNGISVYEARLRLGDRLADTIAKYTPMGDIDVVMPIPDSSRPAAMQVAQKLGVEYREGFYKNRYVGRTFIMPGQEQRKKSVKQKLNAMSSEFKGKNILIVDDSIVRGTTSQEIVQMAREAGANKVTFTSAAPPVRFPHVYGINMPSRHELIAHGRKIPEINRELGSDYLIYQEVADMQAAIIEGSSVEALEMSCFTGDYVTGSVSEEYLSWVEANQLS